MMPDEASFTDEPLRILIADDHDIVREGLCAVIRNQAGMEVVASASNGQEALEYYRQYCPDVVLMDLLMPVKDGIEATSDILSEFPDAHILILTSLSDLNRIIPAIRAGALGYLEKNTVPGKLIAAIRDVAAGGVHLPLELTQRMLTHTVETGESLRTPELTLTLREIQVIRLVAKGLSNAQIAQELVTSERTIGVHVSHVLDKLGLNNRTQIALYALRRGLAGLF